jgi:hypothetical protein
MGHGIYSGQVAMLLPPRSEAPEIMTDLNDNPGRTARGVGWKVNNTNDQRKEIPERAIGRSSIAGQKE